MNKFLLGILMLLMISLTGCGVQEQTVQTPKEKIENFNPPPNVGNPVSEIIIDSFKTLAKSEINHDVISESEYRLGTTLCGREMLRNAASKYSGVVGVKSMIVTYADETQRDLNDILRRIPREGGKELQKPLWKESHKFKIIGKYQKGKDPYKTLEIEFKFIGDEGKCPVVINKDYIINHVKVGMGQEDVRNLLGNPQWEGTDHEFEFKTWNYLYANEGYSGYTEEEKSYGEIDEEGLKSGDVKLQLNIAFTDNEEVYSYSIFTKEGYYNVIDGEVYEGEY